MHLRELRIGLRLGIGFGIILAILSVEIAVSNALIAANKVDLLRGLNLSTAKAELANQMKSSLLESGVAMRNIGLMSDVADMHREEASLSRQNARYVTALEKLTQIGLNTAEEKVVADIAVLNQKLAAPLREATGQALAFNSEGAVKVIVNSIAPINQQAIAEIDRLLELQQRSASEFLARSVAEDEKLKLLMVLIGAAGLAMGTALAWHITRSITIPLYRAVDVARRVSTGDLTWSPEAKCLDEIGQLFDALHDMNRSLAGIAGGVRVATERIAHASSVIARGNLEISNHSEHQAVSMEETAATLEQLTTTVMQTAASAKKASHLASDASNVALKGGSAMSQAVRSMQAIDHAAKKIVDIIGEIDGIAFQTNLLALNAAVEAAHAGGEGRGFAMVAAEVRSLAQRSARAAMEIKQLILDAAEEINTGSQLVGSAGRTMDDLVSSVNQVTTIIGEIAFASSEQASGIAHISQAFTVIEHSTHKNSALIQEASAIGESMQDLAQALTRQVAVFNMEVPGPMLLITDAFREQVNMMQSFAEQ